MKKVIIVLLLLATLSLVGCVEVQKKAWGKGDLPADWAEMFGTCNNSRMNYAQSQVIAKQDATLVKIDKVVGSLVQRVTALEVEFEDLNDPYEVELKRRGLLK